MIRSFIRNLHSGPVALQLRRFVIVGMIAAGVQMALLWAFVDVVGVHYLLGATIAIEITIILQYGINNAWTFEAASNTGTEFLSGLVKTNIVRGSAIPIQLGILFGFVELAGVPYLIANALAIGISGGYRFVLDAKWTWGQ
ncbi:Putative flippase GtrA (transmembrane translocase of bactoprenol-linked glucose) [Halopenitus malekzadehii]|uniref:Putative flippase GtrA (Transmembrane translocase of bactoprenol-linked glucose) n=1 Tax=Halopenitus malekzadehii TaxID=1267564 RepID=A0A1H6JL56_9EURY|nr:GtrA family protein [Halopenitus malekzadehii]SEH59906.1 Putative flippase GtrA (transmembrane translocase of bactoprenol-linked glucose) [Halopenitus malekzadehii]